MADLNLSNVVNISVSAVQAGVGAYNNSNIALFTHEAPGGTFGTAGYKIYFDPSEVVTDFGTGTVTAALADAAFSQQPNLLAGDGYLVVIPLLTAEAIDAAITRTQDLVQYFGILSTTIQASGPLLAAAAVVQPLNKIAFWPQRLNTAIAPGGLLDQIRTGGFSQSRGLYYGGADDLSALVMAAAYASRGLSVNFSGGRTTQTIHLKDLIGVQPDPTITQTLLDQAEAAGADVYATFQGVPKVFTSGANQFFDSVYNQQWLVGALKVASFNVLAQSSTKIPQTEEGVSILKGAHRQVCEQAVSNGYAAPGSWTSSTTFGNQADFLRNIQERGYYIYSAPVAQQLAADRTARKAPLTQIAIKQAGAIHSADVIINVNA